jgi:hypothetical protein
MIQSQINLDRFFGRHNRVAEALRQADQKAVDLEKESRALDD